MTALKPSIVHFLVHLVAMWKYYIIRVLSILNLLPSTRSLFNWPVVGMLPGVIINGPRIHEFVKDILTDAGGTILFKGPWFMGLDFLVTSDHENVNYILSKNFSNFDKGPEFKQIFEACGDGIFNVDGDKWRLQRRMIHNLFKDTKFVMARNNVTRKKVTDGLFVILDRASELGEKVDAQELFRRLTFDTTCMLLLDYDPRCLAWDLPEVEYEKAYCIMEEAALIRHILPIRVWKLCRKLDIGPERILRRAWDTFDEFLHTCISRKREQLSREESKTQEVDLLSYFMGDQGDRADRNNVNFEAMRDLGKTDKFLRDTCFNLAAAGRDTISVSLSWFLWLVSTHPSVEEKIIQEMRGCSGEDDDDRNTNWGNRIFEEDELSKLTYLHACVNETLRMYPPLPLEHKASCEADTLPSGIRIPANTKIVYSLYAMGRMESIWGKDCLEFKPERWISDKTGKIKHVPFHKFIAFNAGPRTCLGKQLALFQIMTVAAAVLWNYRFVVAEDCNVCPNASIVLHMKHGLKVGVSKRWVGKCSSK